jgi:hypothetical protein
LSLSKNSTIKELFDYIYNDEVDVQVVPVTISKPDDAMARLMIVVQGTPNTAHHIMATLMTTVQDLHDIAEQQKAAEPPAKKLVGADGEVLTDDVKLEIVS